MILRAVPRLWALRINCAKTRAPIDLKMSLMQGYMPRLNRVERLVDGRLRTKALGGGWTLVRRNWGWRQGEKYFRKSTFRKGTLGNDYHGGNKDFNFGSEMEMSWEAKMNGEIEIIGHVNILPKIMSISEPRAEFSISRHVLSFK